MCAGDEGWRFVTFAFLAVMDDIFSWSQLQIQVMFVLVRALELLFLLHFGAATAVRSG